MIVLVLTARERVLAEGNANREILFAGTNVVWGAPTGGYSISIATVKSNYVSGEPIEVRIAVKIAGTNNVGLVVCGVRSVYDPQVFTGGKDLPLSVQGAKLLRYSSVISTSVNYLKPLEVWVESIPYDLSSVFDLSSPGTYEIRFNRVLNDTTGSDVNEPTWEQIKARSAASETNRVVKPAKWVKVVSNELTITVVPKKFNWGWLR